MSDQALILKLTRFGDKDLIVHCFSQNHGKLSLFAKSAMTSKKRFVGLTQLAHGEIEFKAGKNEAMGKLLMTDLSLPIALDTPHLHRIARSYYVLELIKKLLAEEMAEPDFYDLTIRSLELLAEHSLHGILRVFELHILVLSGLYPEITSNIKENYTYFDLDSLELREKKNISSISFSLASQKWAQLLLDKPWSSLATLPLANSKEIARLFYALMKKFGHHPFKTVQFLNSLPKER